MKVQGTAPLFHPLRLLGVFVLSAMLSACGGGGGDTATPSYTVTPSAGADGSIEPATAQTVSQGGTTSFTVTPDTGYSIDGISGCDGTLSGDTYTTGAITADCTVTASFSVNSYTVTPLAGANGIISPATAQAVTYGSTASFTITPSMGYHIASVGGTCGGSLSGNTYTTSAVTADCTVTASFSVNSYTVTPSATNGSISPATVQTVNYGGTTSFTITPNVGYHLESVFAVECGASSLSGTTYTTGAITADCIVMVNFAINSYTVISWPGIHGSISPATVQTLTYGDTTSFTVTPDSGYVIDTVSGCGGTLSGTTYTTGSITADCSVAANFKLPPPALTLTPQSVKTFAFSWSDVAYETEYRLLENPDGVAGYSQVATIAANSTGYDLQVSLPKRINASYILQACNSGGCNDSAPVYVSGTLAGAAGYVKASNAEAGDQFGYRVALSGDGNTLAVGAIGEGSNATGIDGNQADNSVDYSGAVYVFTRSGANWSQQAYIKASNSGASDYFGTASVVLSDDGNTLAVGARSEASNATGIDGNQADNSATWSGAVYVYARSGTSWSQQAYVKASNTGAGDWFGTSVALAADGNTMAVGAYGEASAATSIGGNQADNSADYSGAVYVFTRSGANWSQQAYVKASNTGANDYFGTSVALAADGNTLVVGADGEASAATGIDGNQADNSADYSGAVYVYTRGGVSWSQQAYVKASNTGAGDRFGTSVALAADGNTLVVGANQEASNAIGINGDQADNSAGVSGAVYVFTRSGATWSQQAYVKASNTGAGDWFGRSVALTADGNILAVGANQEASSATGIGGNQADNSASWSGAVYVFTRSGDAWSQQAYVKAPNSGEGDIFGWSVALAADGNTLAVGASWEDSNAIGIDGDQTDNSADGSGAVYLY